MNATDHDQLVLLTEKVGALLKLFERIETKIDALSPAQAETARDVHDLKKQVAEQDLRLATQEQRINSLMDAADRAHEVNKAFAAKWATIAAVAAMVMGPVLSYVVPIILKWITANI